MFTRRMTSSAVLRHGAVVVPVALSLALWGWLIRASYAGWPKRPPEAASAVAAPVRWPLPLAYDRASIYGPTDPSPALAAAIADAAASIQRMTGHRPAVQAGSSDRGIVLVRSGGLLLGGEAERLSQLGPEGFLVRSEDDSLLRIVANTDAGLTFGLYHYLRELGFRWFMPGDNWAAVPPPRDIAVRLDRAVTPAFQSRWFFGTGGFGPPTPVDPTGRMSARWSTWMLRNGFGRQFFLGGHAGEAFAGANRAALERHPEYLALVAGKRVPWSVGAHYCVSNPELQKLFVQDRLAELKRVMDRWPDSVEAGTVSVEPADTPGRCECDRCRKIGKGTASDQAFHLANVVARAIRERVPGDRWVSALAYSDHAAPPAFPLEANVHVGVIPEAYQQTGLTAEALLLAWKNRVKRMSVYTYWALPDWVNETPTFHFAYTPESGIRTWHAAGATGVSLQTSYGGGANGIGLYLAGQLLWSPHLESRALLDDFYAAAFRAAASPMRRLLERWQGGFTPSTIELGYSFRDLAEARRLVRADPASLARVRDYEIYLHYLRLWTEYRHAQVDVERARAFLTYLYRIYDSGMVATHRMRELVLNRYTRNAQLSAEFNPGDSAAAGWAAARQPLSDRELAGLMSGGAVAYPAPDVEPRQYASRLVVPRQKATPAGEEPGRVLVLALPTDFEIEVPEGRHLEFEAAIRRHRTITSESVSVFDASGKAIHDERFPADGLFRRLDLAVAPGRYRVRVEDQKAMFTVRPQRGLPMIMRTLFSADLSPRVYFWVPRGLRKIAMYVPSASPIELLDGDGKRVEAPGSGVVIAPVPTGQDGRPWSIRSYKSWETLRMINLPQVFALSPDSLMVPEDVSP